MSKKRAATNIKLVNKTGGEPMYIDWSNDSVLFENHHFYLRIKNKKYRFGKIEDTDDIYNLCIKYYDGVLPPIKISRICNSYSINTVTTNGSIEKLRKFYLQNQYLIDKELKKAQTQEIAQAFQKYKFLRGARLDQNNIRNSLRYSKSAYLQYLFRLQSEKKYIIKTRECVHHESAVTIRYEGSYIFTLENNKYYFVIYENVNDGRSSIVCRLSKYSEKRYYQVLSVLNSYMGGKIMNKRQKLHDDNEIFGIYINVINHKDIKEWTDKINNAIRNF